MRSLNCTFNYITQAKERFCAILGRSNLNLDRSQLETIQKFLCKPKTFHGDLCLNCFCMKRLKPEWSKLPPNELAIIIRDALESQQAETETFISKMQLQQAYINIWLHPNFLGHVIELILDKDNSMLAAHPKGQKDKVMIEYSQPNTHKAFHVGHMRNCALGDSIIRLFEHAGHDVVAANYFGDEGAHVAKCLWLLNKDIEEKKLNIDDVKVEERAEWLGEYYSNAVAQLDMSAATRFPSPGVVIGKVETLIKHPNNPKWTVAEVVFGPNGEKATVVTAGENLKVGDLVPYTPLGAYYKGAPVTVIDKQGVSSEGVLSTKFELGVKDPAIAKMSKKQAKKALLKDKVDILVLPENATVGQSLTEYGRYPEATFEGSVEEVFARRKAESAAVLAELEKGTPYWKDLWQKTGKWSLDEFKRIYKYLDCRFDVDFTESQCSELSMEIVREYQKNGVFELSNGAVGCHLGKKLGFCMLIKSNGSGLYATKDIALAKLKFDQFNIDKSIYVVDASQKHHFEQVFATLEKMGYKQAKKCHHLAYGMVKLASGKMSSRDGTVILFSELKDKLSSHIVENHLNNSNLDPPLTDDEKSDILHNVAIATIKYGMLNHDPMNDIVFDLDAWASPVGETGSYMMFQQTRIASILRMVDHPPPETKPDWKLLSSDEMHIMIGHLACFQSVVHRATYGKKDGDDPNPSMLCTYLFDLAKMFSSWYTNVDVKIIHVQDPVHRKTLLMFIEAVAEVLKKGLNLLGITCVPRM